MSTAHELSPWLDMLITAAKTGVSFGVGLLAPKLARLWKHRHFRGLVGDSKRVKLVLPQIPVREFAIPGASGNARIPDNVPLMPMPEGRAIAHIVDSIGQIVPKLTVEYVTEAEFLDDDVPFISIGGPSVNRVSGQLLREGFPDFNLKYPDHEATHRSTTYKPGQVADKLVEDFGFLFQTKTRAKQTTCLIVCGVWGTGTEIAAYSYFPPSSKSRLPAHHYKKLAKGETAVVVAHAKIDGFRIGMPTSPDGGS